MENLCSPLAPHLCPPLLPMEEIELNGGSHLGGLSWRENAGTCSWLLTKNSGPQ